MLADKVSALVLAKFGELTNNFTSAYSRRKVLAGVVMTTGDTSKEDSTEEPKVICVTTGTKCINGEYMSDTGMSLNDCHAEVIARRCLRRFFFKQLLLHLDPETAGDSIFQRKEPGAEGDGGTGTPFNLKDGYQFHLYISTSPCGDARIFAPHELNQPETASENGDTTSDNKSSPVVATQNGGGGSDRHPNRKARGQLRTKIESGEGTIPVRSSGGIQTWDGVLQGERLLTMSCSDKIARWNIIGVQGM